LHQVFRGIGMVRMDPPQAAVFGFDLRSPPGEIIMSGWDYLLVRPLAAMQGQVHEAGVLASRGQDTAESLAHLAPVVVAHLHPTDLLDADRFEDPFFHEREQITTGGVAEDERQVGDTGAAVKTDRARLARQLGPRGASRFTHSAVPSGLPLSLVAARGRAR